MRIESIVEDGYYVAYAPDGTRIGGGYKKDKRYVEIEAYGESNQIFGEYRITQPSIKVGLISGQKIDNPELPPNSAPTWQSVPTPAWQITVGGTYALSVNTNDIDSDPLTYVWDDTSTARPPGVTLAANGQMTANSGTIVAATTTGHRVKVSDGVNGLVTSPNFSIVVSALPPTGSGKRWNPGHYTRPQGDPFDGTTESQFLATMTSQLANQTQDIPELKGIMFSLPWAWINPTGSQFNWNFIDTMINQAASQGQLIALLPHYKSFLWQNNMPPGTLPGATIEAPADLLGSVSQHNQGYIANLWETAVADRYAEMMEAIALRYDANPAFEAVLTPEAVPSFGGIGAPPGYDVNVYAEKLKVIYTRMDAAFVKINSMPQINSLTGNIENLFEHQYGLRGGIAGPDARETPGTEFFQGLTTSGETPPIDPLTGNPRDYRGQVARGLTISTSTYTKTGRDDTAVFQFCKDQKCTHIWMITNSAVANGVTFSTWEQRKAAVQADPTIIHTDCPTRHIACEGDPGTGPSVITSINFDSFATVINTAPGNGAVASETDNWPVTWAWDGNQYTSFGDGWGFENLAGNESTRASIGVSRISGDIGNFSCQDLWKSGKLMGGLNGKCQSMLGANNKLYMSWDYALGSGNDGSGSQNDAYEASTIWVSNNAGVSWAELIRWDHTDWGGTLNNDGFFAPAFLQFGQNHTGARDTPAYVYMYLMEHDNDDYQVQTPGGISLARCLLSNIESGLKADWSFVTSIDVDNNPTWSTTLANRITIFQDATDGNHVSQVCYNAALGRYIMTTLQGKRRVVDGTMKFGCYDAPEPWGPWNTILKTDATALGLATGASAILWGFSQKWMSVSGLDFAMVGTLLGNDEFGVIQGSFTFG